MRLAFYRGPGDWITRTIRVLTRGPYSHVEIVFTDGARFSASGRAPSGVRFNREPHGEGWDFLCIPATPHQERVARCFCAVLEGSAFKWRGLYRFIFPLLGDGPNSDWYCSELVLWVLQRCFGYLKGVKLKIHPNQLHRLCRREFVLRLCVEMRSDCAANGNLL